YRASWPAASVFASSAVFPDPRWARYSEFGYTFLYFLNHSGSGAGFAKQETATTKRQNKIIFFLEDCNIKLKQDI
ncbi:MAG: hypothetical protein MST12_08090, partial [Spirochaetia bacterium]|nr:hypothetical protein [Spirochaetia bacterium]